MPHGLRFSRRRNAVLALISLALLGVFLPAGGSALATAQAGASVAAPTGGTFTGAGPACAIEAGRAYCWGGNAIVPVAVDTTGVLSGKTLTKISAGGMACALDTSGTAYCWGSNYLGKLGTGIYFSSSAAPVRVDTRGVLAGKKLVQISVGGFAVCALDSTGHAYCWGDNTYGALGDGGTVSSAAPVAVDTSGVPGKTFTEISAGEDYVCGLDTAGAAYCWGGDYRGNDGQLGDGSTANSDVPVAVDTSGVLAGKKLVDIAASATGYSTCALDASGLAYCWGANYGGELGNGNTNDSDVPVAVDASGVLAGKTLTQISPGAATCALDSSGAAYCWGNNVYGELGDGSTVASSDVPVAVNTHGALAGKTLTQISDGEVFTGATSCAASTSGAVYCWGSGFGSVPVANGPSPVTGVTAVEGNRTARVSWTVPVMNTGITSYTASVGSGLTFGGGSGSCTTSATHCTISGLANDTTYRVTVVAHTASADSSPSAAVSVTPGSGVAFTSNPYATESFGNAFRYTVHATGGSPAPAITVSGSLPPGVTFTGQAGGTAVLAGTPDRSASGQYTVTFTAKSKAGTATQGFTLTIIKAPLFGKLPTKLTLQISKIWITIPITPPDGYPLPDTWQAGQLPQGLGLNSTGCDYCINGRVESDDAGIYHFQIVAGSPSGEATHNILILVPGPPTGFTSAFGAQAYVGVPFSVHVTFNGYPAPTLTAGEMPNGVTFNPATGILSGTPAVGDAGQYQIGFTATNTYGTASSTFFLVVD